MAGITAIEGIPELMEECWPGVPEWDEDDEQRLQAEDLRERMAWRFAQGVQDPWDRAVDISQRTGRGIYDVYMELLQAAIVQHDVQ